MTAAFVPRPIRDCCVFRLKPVATANAHLMIDLKKLFGLGNKLESYQPSLAPWLSRRRSTVGHWCRHIWRGSSRRSGTVGLIRAGDRIAALTCRGRQAQATWVSPDRGNRSRLLGGHRQQLGELIVANLGLRKDATAQMLDQIGAAGRLSSQKPRGHDRRAGNDIRPSSVSRSLLQSGDSQLWEQMISDGLISGKPGPQSSNREPGITFPDPRPCRLICR
jgi:hypothetical protein